MIYRSFGDLKLSALGLGTMRLPVIDGDGSKIDEVATAEMVDYAIQNGINYFDTAWMYHGGNSELVMGKILSKYPRESFYLASKFPGCDLSTHGKVKEIFERQLEKCRVDYFDFYLIHSVTSADVEYYCDPKYGTLEYLLEQKKNGRIRHFGFSFHGNEAVMKRFLEVYGDYMEFGQLQLNWLDWTYQNAKRYVEMLAERNIPVWVMEPVRGGGLCKLDPKYMQVLAGLRPGVSAPEWAFRFLQTVPSVTVTLSGMSNMEQLQDNIRIFSEEKPLNEAEWNALRALADEQEKSNILRCTSCRYCVGKCPVSLDIPRIISIYNSQLFSEDRAKAFRGRPEGLDPTRCIGCGECASTCPQSIDVPGLMAKLK